MSPSPILILMRHGQSEWNKQNLFTGWVDIPLSKEGIDEAIHAGHKIANTPIDAIFVSSLVRSQMSAMLAMAVHKGGRVPVFIHEADDKITQWAKVYSADAQKSLIPVYTSWCLNERMYGRLQGLNKKATVDLYGSHQVQLWRRSYDIAPPEGESLQMTAERTIPYFKETILPLYHEGKNILISAHGNSLRSIVMHLLGLSKDEVLKLELATGEPVAFTVIGNQWKRVY